MSLKNKIDHELNRLAASGPNGGTILVATSKGELESDLHQIDAIACTFARFQLRSDHLANATLEQLKKLSDSLSARLNYLLEPISPVESDAESCSVQMRSTPPHKDDDGTTYYELLVRRGGDLSLCRYSKQPGSARQVIPAHVTREVFCRLANDFEATIP